MNTVPFITIGSKLSLLGFSLQEVNIVGAGVQMQIAGQSYAILKSLVLSNDSLFGINDLMWKSMKSVGNHPSQGNCLLGPDSI